LLERYPLHQQKQINDYLLRIKSVERLIGSAFPQQRAFIKDPAKLKALFCTRRAAKSYTAGLYLVKEALDNPGCNCLFIGLTRDSAKSIIWKDILHVIDRTHQLGATFNLTELTVTFKNGSVIKVSGADVDENEMNKFLGRKYRLVCIDEASMYTVNLRNLVYGILKPAMADERGTICLMGTSSNFTRGLFYDITTRKEQGWSVHEWSAHDNPHVAKQWSEELDEIRSLRPLYMETPQFKQWYLNQWVVDTDKLVYKFNEQRNLFDKLPSASGEWVFVLGVDTGWEDDNAFVLCGYHEHHKELYVIRTYNQKRMTFDMVIEKINEFLNDPKYPPCKVIIDGANKQGVESMRVRSAIPFEYADKQDKTSFIEILNGDLVQGKIKIHRTAARPLVNEMMSLVWKTEGEQIVLPKKEHPALPNHLCDAFLYAWRCGYHYHASAPEVKYPIGSKQWYQQQADGIWEREKERLIQESEEETHWPTVDGVNW